MECIQYNHKQRFSVDRFKFSDMKYIDSKLSLIKYLHYYLAKMEFFFVWIRRFLFGFCSNQWLIFVVRIIKTHTMVVHFSGHSRPKRKKTEHDCPGALKLVARDYHWKFNFSPCLSFLMLHVVFHQHINCSYYDLLNRTNASTLPERSVVSLGYRFFLIAYSL